MLDIVSMIPGVVWPAIPNARASQLLAMQFQLAESQWLSPDEILERQRQQLGFLVRHAYQTVPFYRRRLDEVGLPPQQLRGLEEWAHLPLLTRRDIQNAGSQLHCATGASEHGAIMSNVTSGSSGQPVTTLGTTVTRLFYSTLLLRQHLWHQRDVRLKLASIRSLKKSNPNAPRESSTDNWGLGTQDISASGPTVVLDIHSTVEEQAEFLLRNEPDYLNTYPTVVLALAEHFENSDRRLQRLREVRTFGEVLDPHVRAVCRRVWGVPVVDCYSSEELGFIAMQCPQHEHYHVQAETVFVEILDDEGRACKPGEIGRVVITSLHNFAMPLIRYEIGDYAEVGGACSCGRGLPVLTRIVGRQRNMFVLPDGRRVWPSLEVAVEELTSDFPPLQQYQVIQRSVSSVEVLLVAPRLLTDSEIATVRALVDRAIGYPMDVKITYVQQIPRGATGKYEDFRSDVSS